MLGSLAPDMIAMYFSCDEQSEARKGLGEERSDE